MKRQFYIITAGIFIVLSAVFYWLKLNAPEYNFVTLEAGNAMMAILSVMSFFMVTKQADARPQAFVRGVSGASFFKLMVCMIAILVYVLLNRSHIHKATVFVLFGIYAAYTMTETVLLSKLVREKSSK